MPDTQHFRYLLDDECLVAEDDSRGDVLREALAVLSPADVVGGRVGRHLRAGHRGGGGEGGGLL